MNEIPVVFNLTFRTTGGPATYVTWTKDGVNILSLRDIRYTTSQTVLDNGGVFTAGDYSNILTVTGRLPGVYGVSATNDRTRHAVASNTIVSGKIKIIIGCVSKLGIMYDYYVYMLLKFINTCTDRYSLQCGAVQ